MSAGEIRRTAYLASLLAETNRFIGETGLSLIHTDTSFLHYQPGASNPWLTNFGQAEWTLANHSQIIQHHQRSVLKRIFLFPTHQRLTIRQRLQYHSLVKAVLHLQLYEDIRVGALFIPDTSPNLDFSFSVARFPRHSIAWPAGNYYGGLDAIQAIAARRPVLDAVLRRLDDVSGKVLWLSSYRAEHFELGRRIRLSGSWRAFLTQLHQGQCADCGAKVGNMGHIDHQRALNPADSLYHVTKAGNSVLFNLTLLCPACNTLKSNHAIWFPEADIQSIIWDRRIQEYFRATLFRHQGQMPHLFPTVPMPLER